MIADPANIVFVSAVSIWEARIKQSLGKLDVPDDFLAAVRSEAFEMLPINAEHADAIGALLDHHKDPFDRLLIAQAVVENLDIVSADEIFPRYAPRVIWASRSRAGASRSSAALSKPIRSTPKRS